MSARSPTGGRFRICWYPRGAVSGSQRLGVPPSLAGLVVCHSTGPAPVQLEFAPAKSRVRTRRRLPAIRPSHDRLESSGPAPRSATRTPLQGAPVPEGLSADPSPTGPSDPVAIPAPHRSPGDGPPPAISHVLLAWPHRSQHHGLAGGLSSRAERHTPACRGSATGVAADRW